MNSPNLQIIEAKPEHVKAMVHLSHCKRKAYEKVQPIFWKEAEDSNKVQEKWFLELLEHDEVIVLVALSRDTTAVTGFIVGSIINAPPVYDPGGKTLMVDDFCVSLPELWYTVGRDLLIHLQDRAVERGSVQTIVVCGDHDAPKKAFLEESRLGMASRWYVNQIRS